MIDYTIKQEQKICYHELGHQLLSSRIIPPKGLDFERKLNSDTDIESWKKQFEVELSEEFKKIYKISGDLYHGKYGEDGNPWSDKNPCNKEDLTWQNSILIDLVSYYEYSYELDELSKELDKLSTK